ncbi:MAG: hypothetical protein FWD53_07610, partial [Phycisphaerales bacterium]|nr:hypothetical protein [Phycisphaerales bacterium]
VTFPQTDPPSVAIVMLPETQSDKCVIAELCDQPHAARCKEPDVRKASQNGRILVTSLAAELQIENADDLMVGPETRTFLDTVSKDISVPVEELLRSAFVVRFFQW